jgi:hypothetical protein
LNLIYLGKRVLGEELREITGNSSMQFSGSCAQEHLGVISLLIMMDGATPIVVSSGGVTKEYGKTYWSY